MSRPVQYIFLNKGLSMSVGKASAQCAHAAVLSYRFSRKRLIEDWMLGKHYTKIVLQARDEQNLRTIQSYLEDRGFKTELVIDEGLTEIDAHQATALAVEIVDKEDPHTAATFGSFELYRDSVRVIREIDR